MGNNSSHLKSPDLLPIPHSMRKISTFGFAVLWVGMAVVLAAFAIGGAGIQSLSLPMVIVATLIGNLLIGMFITVTGDIGVEHGVSFPVYMRAPFGTIGTHLPSILRGVTASMWFGINTFFGSTAMNAILNVLTGFDNWLVCYIIFAFIQLLNTALGIKAVERFADLAAPIIILIGVWMFTTLSDQALSEGRHLWTWVESPVTGMAAFTAFMLIIAGSMGFWSTLACDISSITRFVKAPKFERNWFKRNKGTLVGNVIALPITQTFIVVLGAVSYIAVFNYDPVVALQEAASGIILGILLLMIVLSQWSTNISANIIPAATIFSNAGGPKVPFWLGVFGAGIIGTLFQPWNLFAALLTFLTVIGAVLSAIVGIIVVDYYILRKRRINVYDLYENEGQYKYHKGINVAGFISWAIGGGIAIFFPTYSFFVGFAISGVLYYFLAKNWYFKTFPQAEIVDPDDEKYLGITVGRDWIIGEKYEEKTLRRKSKDETAAAVDR